MCKATWEGSYQGIKQITSKKTGQVFNLVVLRDYDTFTELELFCEKDFQAPQDIKIGEKVRVFGSSVRGNKGSSNNASSVKKAV